MAAKRAAAGDDDDDDDDDDDCEPPQEAAFLLHSCCWKWICCAHMTEHKFPIYTITPALPRVWQSAARLSAA